MAPEAVNVPEIPVQMVIGETLITGSGLTVTITEFVFTHPAAVVPVTVYVVVAEGLAVTEAPVVPLKPAAAAHE